MQQRLSLFAARENFCFHATVADRRRAALSHLFGGRRISVFPRDTSPLGGLLDGGKEKPVCCVSPGHAVLLLLAHVSRPAVGEEMGGPAPHSAAALPHVAVHPGVRLLQVSSGTAARRRTCFDRESFVLFVFFHHVSLKLPRKSSSLQCRKLQCRCTSRSMGTADFYFERKK